MNFLLDQSTDGRLITWLMKRGYNARRIGRDYPSGLPDEQVLAIAEREGRILITDDRDFGSSSFAIASRTRALSICVSPPSALLSLRRVWKPC